MDATIIASIVSSIATITAAIIGGRFWIKKKHKPKAKDLAKAPNETIPPSQSTDSEHRVESIQSDVFSPVGGSITASIEERLMTSGVRQVLRERILKRVVEQLDPSVRRYETMQAVEEGCRSLGAAVKRSNFASDIIIGWKNPQTEYQGSQKIAHLLSKELSLTIRLLSIEEVNESRRVVEDCEWFRNIGKVLVVDDACYTGSTLKSIERTLIEINPAADIRFAVLSTQDPHRLKNLYYVSTHSTEELLFPWGWSRLLIFV
jgi:hypoxanthine phosphoribosyltransferase